ncbi:UDP-glucuronic acid decarboxylase family protein [Campylobacter concisus]|jgi:NAD-dependent epimerase/dehydratase family protein|uniref:UDP-glucuronic acid decarboxylase family protein n=1 Tax=Campylobacter concisus TaxID=199 RepID=UPI000CD7E7A0|nr:UDP-glucuronic acid decarboxylase family protein [Campylobacter concisus]
MNKTILVTGGAGFIGSHLCTRFVKEYHNVLCLDDLSTGASENIAHLKNYPNFTLIEHDITKPFDYFIDEIYNLACPASPVKYQADPVKTIETCVFGATNCLRLAKKYGAKILQASTSEVYGDPKQHPQKEDYWGNVNPIGIRACYDEGKRAAEALCSSYKQQYYVDVKIVRLFNCYGPNMAKNDGRVISNFIVQALKNSDITIFGDGSQTRSFCYIDDTLDVLVKFMNTDIMGPVNIGNPEEYSIKEIAHIIISLTNSKSPIIYKELPSDDPKRRKPDITLAKELLGWTPKIGIKDGLERTIAYFKNLNLC